jgi:hypothetical protein
VISLRRAAGLAAAAVCLAGCMPEPATTQGRDVATLYNWFMVAAAFVGLLAREAPRICRARRADTSGSR